MKFVFASDSFKGSLSSKKIHEILTQCSKEYFPDAECICVSLGDGGEGTVEAIESQLRGKWYTLVVKNPLGNPVKARFLMLENRVAVMEMAQASGYSLIEHSPKHLLAASTFGTGELIRGAIELGAEKIIIGIGGSATNDGGLGALTALGYTFYDGDGRKLEGVASDLVRVARIDSDNIHSKIKNISVTVMSDVDNPLVGPNGATYTFAEQKGADKETMKILENGMRHYLEVSKKSFRQAEDFEGTRAAGGLGYGLKVYLKADFQSGIETVLSLVEFDQRIDGADLIITGEGRIDWQSAHGKVICGVLNHAKAKKIPLVAIVGQRGSGAETLIEMGLKEITETSAFAPNVQAAIDEAEKYYREAARNLFKRLREEKS